MTEDEMVGWRHRLNGLGFGWALGVGDGQGGLACCGSRGRKELDTTERLHFQFSLSCIGEGNGNPLQCSCLESPRDREACWVYAEHSEPQEEAGVCTVPHSQLQKGERNGAY